MFILKDLWIGSIDNGKIEIKEHEYEIIRKKYIDEKAKLYEMMPSELQEKYEALENCESELHIMEEYDAFVKGFRLGAKMILDIFGDYSTHQTT